MENKEFIIEDQVIEVKGEVNSDMEEEEDSSDENSKFKRKHKCLYDSDVDYFPSSLKQSLRPRHRSVNQTNVKARKNSMVWNCNKCHEVLPTNRLLREHRKVHHQATDEELEPDYKYDEKQDLYMCTNCGAEFASTEEVEKHVEMHKVIYSCEICSQSFTKPYNYATHQYEHCVDKMFRCPLCKYSTPRRTALLTHINCMHLKKFPYVCRSCGKGFTDPVLFKEHDNEHLGVKPFACIVCNKEFSFSRYLLSHQVRNHRVFIEGALLPNQCSICFRIFGKVVTMERHLMRVHDKNPGPHVKKHLCDMCGQGFSRTDKLKIHYRTHTGVKPYRCSYCSKSFIKRDYLIMHERIHSGEKPYSCEYCGKCFNQGAPLRIHIRSHTGERPYVCHICKTGCISKGALNLHFRTCKGN